MKLLKRFISYYKPYRKLFYTDMVCAILVSAVDLAFPQVLSYLTNNLFYEQQAVIVRTVFYVAAGLLGLYILRYFCQYYITSWGHIMGARMEGDMRRDLFTHLQRLSFSYYDKNNTGEMLSKLVSDLFDISELAHHGPENIFISVLKIAGAFTFLMVLNVKMTLILMAVTILMVVFTAYQNARMRSVFMDNRKKIAGVNSRVQDSLSGIRVVKSFVGEELEQRKFAESNDEFLHSKVASYKIMGRYFAGNNFFQGLLYIAIIVAGGYFVANGSLRITDLAVYALYINIYLNPIDTLLNFTEMFQRGFAGFKRFVEVLDTAPEIEDREGAAQLTNVRGDIQFDNVSFRYGDGTPVLDGISLNIEAGKRIALVGPSGGGKTTLCSLLPRFYDVTQGRVTIDGKDIRDVTIASLRSAIGIVQQDVYLFAGSIRDNIAYGKVGATDEEIIEAAKNANIHDYIVSLEDGYDTFVGERGVRLSGGQKQRISIARVFLKNPPVLILDEATSALDNESERYIQRSLDHLSKSRTTIMIAHRLSTIKNADEIIVITDEGIQESGSHEKLLAIDGIYARYYKMQFEGLERSEWNA